MDSTPSPETVVPLVAAAAEALYDSLRHGIGYADNQQPDLKAADPWYWSHSARFAALGHLVTIKRVSWDVVPKVPNTGIHIEIGGLHRIRVLRSLNRQAPHPGGNRARERAWVGVPYQLPLALGSLEDVPLSLIADWHMDEDREPLVYLSLPIGPWKHRENPRYHWRFLLPQGVSVGIEELPSFAGGDDGDPTREIHVDPSEWGEQ
jgi:hypothetical protein